MLYRMLYCVTKRSVLTAQWAQCQWALLPCTTLPHTQHTIHHQHSPSHLICCPPALFPLLQRLGPVIRVVHLPELLRCLVLRCPTLAPQLALRLLWGQLEQASHQLQRGRGAPCECQSSRASASQQHTTLL